MAISLQKGGNVSLSKQAPGLKRVCFGLGWDVRKTDGSAFDLDASAFVLDGNGKVLSDQHFVFYNNTRDPSGAVTHKGDNRTGEGEGDDEVIEIGLDSMEASAAKVAFVVTIHDAEARKLTGLAHRLLVLEDMLRFRSQDLRDYDFGGYALGTEDPKLASINRFKDSFGGRIVAEPNYVSLPLHLCLAVRDWARRASGRVHPAEDGLDGAS